MSTFSEALLCVKQWGCSGEHSSYGCCSQGTYSLVGGGDNKTDKIFATVSWSQIRTHYVVGTEPGSDRAAAFQTPLASFPLSTNPHSPPVLSVIQSSALYSTSLFSELLFCGLFCVTSGSPRRCLSWCSHRQRSSQSHGSKQTFLRIITVQGRIGSGCPKSFIWKVVSFQRTDVLFSWLTDFMEEAKNANNTYWVPASDTISGRFWS